jgi:acetyl esterase/lipase
MRLMLLCLAALGSSSCAEAPKPPRPSQTKVPLWPERAPRGDGSWEPCPTELEVYLPPEERNTGAAIVVCPGGGYIQHVMNREGYPIAEWLTAHGIAAVLLRYRLPDGRPFVPLLDAQRALRTVRANSRAWGVDSARVGILGFSAGGHVASTAGTHFDAGRAADPDPVERLSSRPDFQMLVYPVVTMGQKTNVPTMKKLLGPDPSPELVALFSNEKQIRAETPPAFLAHAKDDAPVPPENSRDYAAALRSAGVPVEYLELPSGGHGLNGCKGPLWEQWKAASLRWLAARGFIRDGE